MLRRHAERDEAALDALGAPGVEPTAVLREALRVARVVEVAEAVELRERPVDGGRLHALSLEVPAHLGDGAVAVAEIAEAEVEGLLKLSLRVSCPLMDQAAHAASSRAGAGGASPLGGTVSGSIGVTRSRLIPSAS